MTPARRFAQVAPLSLALLFAAICALPHVAAAGPPSKGDAALLPKGVTYVTSVEGIDQYRLDNGLQILLFPDASKQTITVNITYLVGSRHENYGETGMAHLLEHLLFKGSANHKDVPAELTAHGCRPNGSTWFDRTNYFETFAASDENLTWALDLEADRMVNSFIAKKDLDSEMTVVRNEFEAGENNPQEVLSDRILSTAYLWHNYGKSTIGSRSDIENVPIERLQAFYRQWYQPDNAVLVVGGKFLPNQALSLTAVKFGAIPKPARVLPAIYTEEPAQDGERTVTLKRVGDTQTVGLAYHIPAGSHPDFPACQVLAYILGDTPSGRLHKALVETKKAASVSAWAMQFHDPGMLYMSAEVLKEKPVEDARDTMIRLVEAAGAARPSAEEVERARQSLMGDWERSMRNSERAAIGLSEWAAMGDWRLLFLHRDHLKGVQAEDVQRVAAAYLRPSNRTVGIYSPTETPARVQVPPAPNVAAMLENYKGGVAMASGEEFDATPGHIESLVLRTSLPSGLKVVLLPKKTRAANIQISMNLHFGDEKSLRGRSKAGELAGDILLRGTRKHTRQQIQDEMDRLQARIFVGGSATGAFAGCEVTREHLGDALRLLAEILREPSFPDSEFEMLKQERLVGLEDSKKDPRQVGRVTLQRHLNPWPADDPRYVATAEEEIEAVKKTALSQVTDFYRRFYGASAGEISVVGDIDPEEIQGLLQELFGNWKSELRYARLEDPYRAIPPIDEKIEIPDKESAAFGAGLSMEMRDDDPDYPAMVLGNVMTGGGFLNSRLATRIRRKDGLSYGVGSFLFAGPWDKRAYFGAFAIYAPQNSEKLVTAFREEIDRILKDGFTEQEVAEAKTGWLQRQQVSRSSDRELAGDLATRAFQDRTLAWDEAFESKISRLGADEILAAMRRQLDPKKINIVQVGSFAKAMKAEGHTEK